MRRKSRHLGVGATHVLCSVARHSLPAPRRHQSLPARPGVHHIHCPPPTIRNHPRPRTLRPVHPSICLSFRASSQWLRHQRWSEWRQRCEQNRGSRRATAAATALVVHGNQRQSSHGGSRDSAASCRRVSTAARSCSRCAASSSASARQTRHLMTPSRCRTRRD